MNTVFRPNRQFLHCVLLLGILAMFGGGPPQAAVADMPAAPVNVADLEGEIASHWIEIADVVLARHVDPPTRQEMIKVALQAVFKKANQDPPPSLPAKLSRAGGTDELCAVIRSYLVALWEAKPSSYTEMEDEGVRGLLEKVNGVPHSLIPLSEFYVQQQLRDNRYVGIGIQLAMKNEYPTMAKAFPRGPAWQAGGRDGDQMVSIDGIDAKNMPLTRVIELLRGQEGKPTTVVVRQPDSEDLRPLNMVRGVVPFDTVQGSRRDEDQNWEYKIATDPRIAYLKIESLRGSTPAELRRVAGQLHVAGCRALVLDLRKTQPGELRHAVMVADALLGAGPIGEVLTAHGRQHYDASADQLFAGWPMVALVDQTTRGQGEWIAAALQDSSRATIMGTWTTAGQAGISELVELPNGIGGVRMTTGVLFRRHGKPMATRPSAATMRLPQVVPVWPDPATQSRIARLKRSRGIVSDKKIKTNAPINEAVALLQGKLKATTTPMK